jgi:hypothetical protein
LKPQILKRNLMLDYLRDEDWDYMLTKESFEIREQAAE